MMRRPGAGGRGGPYLILLLLQVFRIGLENIPPVTLVVGGMNVALHYLFDMKGWFLEDVCIGAPAVWSGGQLYRLVTAAFFHVDDIHLYYNMVSFLMKGRMLEPLLGSKRFALMIGVFTLLSNALMVIGSVIMDRFFEYSGTYYSCAVGFSAVIFALKVVATHLSTSPTSQVMGLPFAVPTKYLSWFELILVSILVPRSSFFGHLCGILAGTLYSRGYLEALFRVGEQVLGFLDGVPQQGQHAQQGQFNPQATNYYQGGGGGGGGGGFYPTQNRGSYRPPYTGQGGGRGRQFIHNGVLYNMRTNNPNYY